MPTTAAVPNYASATSAHHAAVQSQVESEILHGNYRVALLDQPPAIVSALGAVPKANSDRIRLIHDCSRPSGLAVNDYAADYKFRYQSLDDATALISPNCYLAKVDLRAAYRTIPVHPDCFKFLSLKWRFAGEAADTLLFDSKLCFGAKLAPAVFNRITQAVRRMLLRRGIICTVYLDDFLIVAPSAEECAEHVRVTVSLLSWLGFYLAWEKIVGPAQRLVFLGVLIDTRAMLLELPAPKLAELSKLLDQVAAQRRISKRQLLTLIGKLSWAARVVRGGRTFVRRLIDTSLRLRRPGHRIRTRGSFMLDISFWRDFLSTFNGKALLITDRITELSTDACPIAWGAVYKGDWAYGTWAADQAAATELPINQKELLALLFAARRWGSDWRESQVIWHTDNICAATWVNKGTSRDPAIMTALRELFWLSVTCNFHILARYLPGTENWASDAVSRLHEPQMHHSWLPLCQIPLPPTLAAAHMSSPSYADLCFRLRRTDGPLAADSRPLAQQPHKTGIFHLPAPLHGVLPRQGSSPSPSFNFDNLPLHCIPRADTVIRFNSPIHLCHRPHAQGGGLSRPGSGLLGGYDPAGLPIPTGHSAVSETAIASAASTPNSQLARPVLSTGPSSVGGNYARLVGASAQSKLDGAGGIRPLCAFVPRRLCSDNVRPSHSLEADEDNSLSRTHADGVCPPSPAGQSALPRRCDYGCLRRFPLYEKQGSSFCESAQKSTRPKSAVADRVREPLPESANASGSQPENILRSQSAPWGRYVCGGRRGFRRFNPTHGRLEELGFPTLRRLGGLEAVGIRAHGACAV